MSLSSISIALDLWWMYPTSWRRCWATIVFSLLGLVSRQGSPAQTTVPTLPVTLVFPSGWRVCHAWVQSPFLEVIPSSYGLQFTNFLLDLEEVVGSLRWFPYMAGPGGPFKPGELKGNQPEGSWLSVLYVFCFRTFSNGVGIGEDTGHRVPSLGLDS